MQILFRMKFAVIVPQDFWEEMSVFLSEAMFEDLQSLIFVNDRPKCAKRCKELNNYIKPPQFFLCQFSFILSIYKNNIAFNVNFIVLYGLTGSLMWH